MAICKAADVICATHSLCAWTFARENRAAALLGHTDACVAKFKRRATRGITTTGKFTSSYAEPTWVAAYGPATHIAATICRREALATELVHRTETERFRSRTTSRSAYTLLGAGRGGGGRRCCGRRCRRGRCRNNFDASGFAGSQIAHRTCAALAYTDQAVFPNAQAVLANLVLGNAETVAAYPRGFIDNTGGYYGFIESQNDTLGLIAPHATSIVDIQLVAMRIVATDVIDTADIVTADTAAFTAAGEAASFVAVPAPLAILVVATLGGDALVITANFSGNWAIGVIATGALEQAGARCSRYVV